jgi:tetratricopeptide (TPR) repeat protein
LRSDELEPRLPSGLRGGALDALSEDLETVWDAWETATAEDPGANDAETGRELAHLIRMAAAPYAADRDTDRSRALFERATELDASIGPLVQAAEVEREAYLDLAQAEWMAERGAVEEAAQLAKAALGRAKAKALRKSLKRLARPAKPLRGAPTLFTFNSIGTMLHGSRDASSDGWYTSTLFFVILWLPILPIASYRVRQEGGQYFFSRKEPLSPFERLWQAALGLLVVFGVGAAVLAGHFGSDERKLDGLMAEARKLEEKGDRQAALERYRSILVEWKDKDPEKPTDLGPVGEGILRVLLAEVPRPCTPTSPDVMRGVVAELQELPPRARSAKASAKLAIELVGCGREVTGADADAVSAKLALLSIAREVDRPAADGAGANEEVRSTRLGLAAQAEKSRPRLAFEQLVLAGEHERALEIAKGWKDEPGLLDEAAHLVRPMLAGVSPEAAASVRGALDRAESRAKASQALLENGDEAEVQKAVAEHPGDEVLLLALVGADRAKGDVATALARIEKLGPPEATRASTQIARATCLRELGRLDDAAKVLSDLVAERILGFQEAQRTFGAALMAAQQRAQAVIQSDNPPADLVAKVEAASTDAQKGAAIDEWMFDTMAGDANVVAAREVMGRESGVVAASIELGSIELARADKVNGPAREERLRSAERAFLAVASGAAGDPLFQLGLAKVYHRTGKIEQGDELFQKALASDDPEASLGVIQAYRELGVDQKAQAAAEKVYESKVPEPVRHQAASIRALMSPDIEERDEWFAKADQADAFVKRSREEIRALRLARQGKDQEADRILARLLVDEEKAAKTLPTQANNAAVLLGERYAITGDPTHLARAQKLVRSASTMLPDNAILTGNLSKAERHLAMTHALEKVVHCKDLRLGGGETVGVIDEVLSGPKRDVIIAALRADPAWRQSLETLAHFRALAPGAAEAYLDAADWLMEIDDAKAVAELESRARAPDAADLERERAQAKARRTDGTTIRGLKEHVAIATARIERARNAGHAPTLAVALVAAGNLEVVLAGYEKSPERVRRAVTYAREAKQIAPELLGDAALGGVLVAAALFEAAAESGTAGEALHELMLEDGMMVALHALLGDAQYAGTLAALRKRPELAEAVQLLLSPSIPRASVFSWVVGKVAESDALQKAGSAGLQARPWTLSYYRMRAKLSGPGSPDEKTAVLVEQAMK